MTMMLTERVEVVLVAETVMVVPAGDDDLTERVEGVLILEAVMVVYADDDDAVGEGGNSTGSDSSNGSTWR